MKEYLSKEQIEQSKDYFETLLREVLTDETDKVEELITKLESSDFFYAPATTQYYGSYPGGLCEHSLQVLDNMLALGESLQLGERVPYRSIVIVALLHEMCKMNKYELGFKNVKNHHPKGKLTDGNGKFDWESVSTYQSRPLENRFVYGTDGETSEFMVRQFINLTLEESVAIMNYKGDSDGNQSRGTNLANIFGRYPLAALLHSADVLACFVNDKLVKDRENEQPNTSTTETVQESENTTY